MTTLSAEEFLDLLQRLHLLPAAPLAEARRLGAARPVARDLAAELLRRDLLTPYQVNLLLQGRGSELVLGSYVLLRRLAEGGMGQVFQATHAGLARVVALKVVRKDRLSHPDAVRRFQHEIRAAAQLDHPHIVHVFDADQVGGTHFFTMEYVEGTDLHKRVKERGPLPGEEVAVYLQQAARALQHCMERGLVHRDIKPSNLLVTGTADTPAERRVLKVLDMGLARLRVGDRDGNSLVTGEGEVIGTPDYMAPEQASSSHAVDIRADLYSLGCTAYYLLTGSAPFPGGTIFEKIDRHRQAEPLPLESRCPGLPPALAAAVRKLMAKQPADRWQKPAELAAALEPLVVTGVAAGVVASPQAPSAAPPTLIPGVPSEGVAGTPPTLATGVATPAPDTTIAPALTEEPTFTFAEQDTATDPASVTRQAAEQRRTLWWSVAGSLLLLGVAGLVGWLVLRRAPVPPPPPSPSAEEHARKELNDLLANAGDPAADRADLARQLRAFRMRHPGTASALGAARRLRHLPSPLDALRREAIPEAERPPWLPPEVVAVFGDPRERLWGTVESLAYSPDGATLAGVGEGRLLHVWDVAEAKELAVLAGVRPGAAAVAFAPDGVTVAFPGENKGVVVGDIRTGKARVVLKGDPAGLRCLAFAPDGRAVAAGRDDGRVVVWDVVTKGVRYERKAHAAAVVALAFGADGKLLSGDEAGVVHRWTGDKSARLFAPPSPLKPSACLAFSGRGKFLAVGTDHVAVFDLGTGKALARSPAEGGRVKSLAISADGLALAWVVSPAAVRRWNWKDAGPSSLRGKGQPVSVALAPDGKAFAVSSTTNAVVLFDAAGAEHATLGWEEGSYTTATFHPDGTALARATGRGEISLWDLEKRQVRRAFAGGQSVDALAVSANGRRLLAAGGGSVRAWDLKYDNDQPVFVHPGYDAAFAPDGTRLAVAAAEAVEMWDLEKLPPARTRTLAGYGINTRVAWSPDGQALAASGNVAGQLRLWPTCGPGQPADLSGLTFRLNALTFAPDGRTLAAASPGHPVLLYDVPTGQARPHPAGRFGGGQALAYSPDGGTLAWADRDVLGIALWDAACGKVRALRMPGMVLSLGFAPDGRHLAVTSANGSVYVLRLEGP